MPEKRLANEDAVDRAKKLPENRQKLAVDFATKLLLLVRCPCLVATVAGKDFGSFIVVSGIDCRGLSQVFLVLA